MAVTISVNLPDNPGTGALRFIPLGGNGYTAPFAMWQLRAFAATGDATAGALSLTVRMDPRYCSMVGYASMNFPGTTPDPYPLRWLLTGVRASAVSRREGSAPADDHKRSSGV